MLSRVALFLGAISTSGGDSCGSWSLAAMNTILKGSKIVVNHYIHENSPQTYGDCDGVTAPSMLPCKSDKDWPLKQSVGGVADVNLWYLTGLHNWTLTNLYVECHPDSEGVMRHYMTIELKFDLALGLNVVGPLGSVLIAYSCKPGEKCLFRTGNAHGLKGVTGHFSGRLKCAAADKFKIELSSNNSISFDRKLKAQLYQSSTTGDLEYDFTGILTETAKDYADSELLDCNSNAALSEFCALTCGTLGFTPTTTVAPGEQCNRFTRNTCGRHWWGYQKCPGGQDCQEGVCYCPEGSCAVNDQCMSCTAGSDVDCSNSFWSPRACPDHQILGNSFCDGSKCQCSPGSCLQSGHCLPFCDRDTGKHCAFGQGCQLRGVGNSFCSSRFGVGTCICHEDFCANNSQCVPKEEVNELMLAGDRSFAYSQDMRPPSEQAFVLLQAMLAVSLTATAVAVFMARRRRVSRTVVSLEDAYINISE